MNQPAIKLTTDNARQVHQESTSQHGFIYRAIVFGSSLSPKKRLALYTSILLLSLSLVWLPISLFLAFSSPKFTSEWTLIMPGAGSGHAVNLDSLGQATANIASPFTNTSIDPLVNYREIVTSHTVLSKAAAMLDISVKSFGKPRIKLIDQTSLMQFKIKGDTPEQARDKSLAIYQALQNQLEILRNDEVARITKSSLSSIEDFGNKLQQTQLEKLNFQSRNSIISVGQFEQLVTQMEYDVSTEQKLKARERFLQGQIQHLLTSVRLKPEEVSYAITLRNDSLFQAQLSRQAELKVQIDVTSATWGSSHPKLNQLQATLRSINQAIALRGKQLTKNQNLTTNELIELGSGKIKAILLEKLAQFMAEAAGVSKQLSQLQINIKGLKKRIENGAADAIKLEELSRKQQVATTVFSTALAKQDIGKVDRFASYPLIQILAAPTLPESPDKLHIKLALVGGIAATLFIICGLLTLWIRKRLLQKILLNESSGSH
ncbi:hypothetical protein KCM76_23200 [Zooshikella marina]|uniref:GumC family protein n=1 Tax=Zooshikella ganghwensis TaxID=202772 RepID=UPI001BAEB8B5|nr:hypothetical protein [Zooshikella ganghwensis]MBU2708921.1 hypothetical protein [Zooshikella ganghwensis]